MRELRFFLDRLDTPIGEMLIVADGGGALRAVDWADHQPRMLQLLARQYDESGFTMADGPCPAGLRRALERYFAGELCAIDGLLVKAEGTAFQHKVWDALRTIPGGDTLFYAGLAARIGQPSAVRAVGLANGANPVGVVVPCHRVIGTDGSLTGYGGGTHRKAWLLRHEAGATAQSAAQQSLF